MTIKPQKLKYTHDAMIDQIIANPRVKHYELADIFGYSKTWINTVMSTDGFKARLAERKRELVDPVIIATLDERLTAVAAKSLEVVMDKLSKEDVKDKFAADIFQIATRSLGYGVAATNNGQINNYVVALPDKSASSADWVNECTKNAQAVSEISQEKLK